MATHKIKIGSEKEYNAIMKEIGLKNRSEKVPSSNNSEISDTDKDKSKSSNVADEVPSMRRIILIEPIKR